MKESVSEIVSGIPGYDLDFHSKAHPSDTIFDAIYNSKCERKGPDAYLRSPFYRYCKKLENIN